MEQPVLSSLRRQCRWNGILISRLVIFLGELIIFFFEDAYSLIEHLDGVLESVGVAEPILLLELFHISKVELRD